MGEGHLGEVTTGGVHDAFGLARGARGVQQEEQLLGIHRFGRAALVGSGHEFVIPVVATLHHWHVVATAAHHHHGRDAGCVVEGFVGHRLQWEHLTAAMASVGGDEHLGLGIVDAITQRMRAEATEHHTVRRADAGTGEHGHRGFRNHRQVDVHPIALGYAEALQHVGEPFGLGQQFGVGDGARVAGLTLEMDGHLVAPAGFHMAIEAVVAHVQLATHEPLRERQIPFADGVPRGCPTHQLFSLACPEPFVVLVRLVVEKRAGDQRLALEAIRRREAAVLPTQCVDRVCVDIAHVEDSSFVRRM